MAGRAAGIKCRVLTANRSPVVEPGPAEAVYPLDDLDLMLPQCDTVLIACALAPETRGLIDARRLALLKPGALLINVTRAPIIDEDALYGALKSGHLGGAALDVWWQYPTVAKPDRRPSRRPFHELPNVLMTPHCSSSSDATAERRWSVVAGNLDRFARGEPLNKHRASNLTGRDAPDLKWSNNKSRGQYRPITRRINPIAPCPRRVEQRARNGA